MIFSWSKWALLASAFFIAVPLLSCNAGNGNGVGVKRIIDGDTIRLSDDRLVRLIGINTPEIGRDGKPSEPFARKAAKRLKHYISDSPVRLELGAEAKDRHNRTLAYVTLPDGRDASALLLKEGLGLAITIAPNSKYATCYYAAEHHARLNKLGVWQNNPVKRATELSTSARGFHIIRANVLRLRQSQSETYVELTGGLTVRVPRYASDSFSRFNWPEWLGKTIEVRGWISSYRGTATMSIKHPAVIRDTQQPLSADLSACDVLI